jgi:hypothetical protein
VFNGRNCIAEIVVALVEASKIAIDKGGVCMINLLTLRASNERPRVLHVNSVLSLH